MSRRRDDPSVASELRPVGVGEQPQRLVARDLRRARPAWPRAAERVASTAARAPPGARRRRLPARRPSASRPSGERDTGADPAQQVVSLDERAGVGGRRSPPAPARAAPPRGRARRAGAPARPAPAARRSGVNTSTGKRASRPATDRSATPSTVTRFGSPGRKPTSVVTGRAAAGRRRPRPASRRRRTRTTCDSVVVRGE